MKSIQIKVSYAQISWVLGLIAFAAIFMIHPVAAVFAALCIVGAVIMSYVCVHISKKFVVVCDHYDRLSDFYSKDYRFHDSYDSAKETFNENADKSLFWSSLRSFSVAFFFMLLLRAFLSFTYALSFYSSTSGSTLGNTIDAVISGDNTSMFYGYMQDSLYKTHIAFVEFIISPTYENMTESAGIFFLLGAFLLALIADFLMTHFSFWYKVNDITKALNFYKKQIQ